MSTGHGTQNTNTEGESVNTDLPSTSSLVPPATPAAPRPALLSYLSTDEWTEAVKKQLTLCMNYLDTGRKVIHEKNPIKDIWNFQHTTAGEHAYLRVNVPADFDSSCPLVQFVLWGAQNKFLKTRVQVALVPPLKDPESHPDVGAQSKGFIYGMLEALEAENPKPKVNTSSYNDGYNFIVYRIAESFATNQSKGSGYTNYTDHLIPYMKSAQTVSKNNADYWALISAKSVRPEWKNLITLVQEMIRIIIRARRDDGKSLYDGLKIPFSYIQGIYMPSENRPIRDKRGKVTGQQKVFTSIWKPQDSPLWKGPGAAFLSVLMHRKFASMEKSMRDDWEKLPIHDAITQTKTFIARGTTFLQTKGQIYSKMGSNISRAASIVEKYLNLVITKKLKTDRASYYKFIAGKLSEFTSLEFRDHFNIERDAQAIKRRMQISFWTMGLVLAWNTEFHYQILEALLNIEFPKSLEARQLTIYQQVLAAQNSLVIDVNQHNRVWASNQLNCADPMTLCNMFDPLSAEFVPQDQPEDE